ncbi:MAG TPA: ATP-binding protein [Thermoanaerobaculia bacterium]|nr:ATP-binding protein [Thermoanaerobaculia bacterium]
MALFGRRDDRDGTELNLLKKRLADTEAHPLKRVPVEGLSGDARQIAESLNARLDAVAGAEKEQQQFIADVSHELRTPLTVLRGTLEVALEEERAPEEYRETLGNALLEVRHLSRLSQNLLFLVRGESGRITLSFANLDLTRLLSDLVRDLASAAGDRGLSVTSEIPEKPITAFVDADRFRQVFHNLFENAMRYTPAGGAIRVRLSEAPGEARMDVSDTGIGIPPQDQPFIFERFFRSDRARRAYTGGSGLGLSIVRWIVDAHKGTIAVESAPGKGSTFTVRLPLIR